MTVFELVWVIGAAVLILANTIWWVFDDDELYTTAGQYWSHNLLLVLWPFTLAFSAVMLPLIFMHIYVYPHTRWSRKRRRT